VTAEKASACADYILGWLRTRNGGELENALVEMRVRDAEIMRSELETILRYEGHPPNWIKP
jgi:hypothetical protein